MVTMQADETAKLQTLEDRARVREEIQQCLAEPLEGDMPASISANQEEESVLKKSSLSTLQDVLEASQLRQTADPQGAEQKEVIALNRLKALLPPMHVMQTCLARQSFIMFSPRRFLVFHQHSSLCIHRLALVTRMETK